MNKPLTIIQLSDLHLSSDKQAELLGVNTQKSLRNVLILLQQFDDIDMILLSGDLSQDGSERAYKRIAKTLGPLNIPVYFVPGNHDDIDALLMTYPKMPIFSRKQVVKQNWNIILLNSKREGCVEGYLEPDELIYLDHCLATNPNKHALIVMHHQPITIGSHWLDEIGLSNKNDFWKVIDKYPQTKAVLFGHVHQDRIEMRNNVRYYAAPSTCIQFKKNEPEFALENIPPGFRLIELHENGDIHTEIKRIDHYIGTFDVNAQGY